jgi:hypothetical protein
MIKLYCCHEADPNLWGGIQIACLRLLTHPKLDRYRKVMPNNEDRQDKWEAIIDNDTKKYVSLLVGQMDDEEQRAERDEENNHDTLEWDQTTQNFFFVP